MLCEEYQKKEKTTYIEESIFFKGIDREKQDREHESGNTESGEREQMTAISRSRRERRMRHSRSFSFVHAKYTHVHKYTIRYVQLLCHCAYCDICIACGARCSQSLSANGALTQSLAQTHTEAQSSAKAVKYTSKRTHTSRSTSQKKNPPYA